MNNDTLTAALAGLVLGGTLAGAAGDFLLLFTGGLAAGGFSGAVAGLVRDWRRRRSSRGSTTYLYSGRADAPRPRRWASTARLWAARLGSSWPSSTP
jgi:hypothetical protein